MSPAIPQGHPSGDSSSNFTETETLASIEPPSFEFLEEFDVFGRTETEGPREHRPPDPKRDVLHYYRDSYGVRPVERERETTVVWLRCEKSSLTLS